MLQEARIPVPKLLIFFIKVFFDDVFQNCMLFTNSANFAREDLAISEF